MPMSPTEFPVSDSTALWAWASQTISVSVVIWLLFIFFPLQSITYSIWSQCPSLANILHQWDLDGVSSDGERQGQSFYIWWYHLSKLFEYLSCKLVFGHFSQTHLKDFWCVFHRGTQWNRNKDQFFLKVDLIYNSWSFSFHGSAASVTTFWQIDTSRNRKRLTGNH